MKKRRLALAMSIIVGTCVGGAEARANPGHEDLYQCASALDRLESPNDDASPGYESIVGRHANEDGKWFITENGAYFVPYSNRLTYVYVENLGEGMRIPVYPEYCTNKDPSLRLPNDPACTGRNYTYAVTDGSPAHPPGHGFALQSYADIAVQNCEYSVSHNGGPHAWDPAPFSSTCTPETRSSCSDDARQQMDENTQKCRVMNRDGGILNNWKNANTEYKSQFLADLKARAKGNASKLRGSFNRPDLPGNHSFNDFAKGEITDGLRSCRRLGVLSEHDVTTIITAPRPVAGSGGSGTTSGAGGATTGH